jgi:hypothetical protein
VNNYIFDGNYILDGKIPVLEPDIHMWGAWLDNADRHVDKTKIGGAEVSTVFLGIDHSFEAGPPLLFETMVFGGPLDQEQDRCSTWEQAQRMHNDMCTRVREASQ